MINEKPIPSVIQIINGNKRKFRIKCKLMKLFLPTEYNYSKFILYKKNCIHKNYPEFNLNN